jgi:PAS domain S-box-containing protein
MILQKQKHLNDICILISVIAGWAVVALNLIALAGWVFKINFLITISPHWSPTRPNIVVFSLLAGTALLLSVSGRKGAGAAKFILASLVSCAGLLTLFQRLTGIHTGFDTLFFKTELFIPGMDYSLAVPLVPALNLLFAGFALLLLNNETPRRRSLSQALALFIVLSSTTAMLAQLYGITSLGMFPLATKISIHGSLTMLLLGVAILFSRPDVGVMRMVSSDTLSGGIIRRVSISAVVVMVCFGWLREYIGVSGAALGSTAIALFGVLAVFILFFYYVGDVYRLELGKALVDRLLLENERKLQAIMDNTPSIIVVADLERRVIFVNRQFEKVFNLPKEVAAGKMLREIYLEMGDGTSENPPGAANLASSLEKEETLVTPLGPRTYITHNFPLLGTEGRAYALVSMSTDITDRKAAEENTLRLNRELNLANKELDAFTHSVSHDLRAPLRAIEGFSKMILVDHGTNLDEDGCKLLARVCDNSTKMLQLTEDLLNFSKCSQSQLESSSFNMTELVKDVSKEINLSVPGGRVNIEVAELPPACGDRKFIRQVLLNLIGNAVKFTAGKVDAFVQVGVLRDADPTVYYVRDNGAGFDMQYSDKLFGVFQRLHSQQEFKGNGVGLAIVHRIISRHGGRIWAEGKPGEGAVFYFTLAKGKE